MSTSLLNEFCNRLEKNKARLLNFFIDKEKTEAFRLYDGDMPEFPYYLDKYGQDYVLSIKTRHNQIPSESDQNELQKRLSEVLKCKVSQVHLKIRKRQTQDQLYQKLNETKSEFSVSEGPLNFLVNLNDYLDTGLFLDHRPLRKKLRETSNGLRVLNLFCYTGSLSVAAAYGGAFVTSLDLSKTYIEWSQRNFLNNQLDPLMHRFFKQDAIKYLHLKPVDQYDLIIFDPPSFSQSKKMTGMLDIQNDHTELIQLCMSRLKPKGKLIFSTNRGGFEIDKTLAQKFKMLETTDKTIPEDFAYSRPHMSFEFTQS